MPKSFDNIGNDYFVEAFNHLPDGRVAYEAAEPPVEAPVDADPDIEADPDMEAEPAPEVVAAAVVFAAVAAVVVAEVTAALEMSLAEAVLPVNSASVA